MLHCRGLAELEWLGRPCLLQCVAGVLQVHRVQHRLHVEAGPGYPTVVVEPTAEVPLAVTKEVHLPLWPEVIPRSVELHPQQSPPLLPLQLGTGLLGALQRPLLLPQPQERLC